MKLFYSHNVANEHKLGLVVCNTAIKRDGETLLWSENAAKDAKYAEDTMKSVFGIDDVATLKDASKALIISAFDKL